MECHLVNLYFLNFTYIECKQANRKFNKPKGKDSGVLPGSHKNVWGVDNIR
jgi:hypothetical protein